METKVNEIKEEVKAVDTNNAANTSNDEINNLIKVSKEAIEAKLGLFTYDVNRIRNCCPIIVKTQNVDEAGNIVDEDEMEEILHSLHVISQSYGCVDYADYTGFQPWQPWRSAEGGGDCDSGGSVCRTTE